MSRATIIDERVEEEIENQEDVFENQLEEVEEPQDDVPEKYRGKSATELVRMHQEAESLLGRQSHEVGDLRKVVDDYIGAQLVAQQNTPQQQQVNEQEDVDFFVDPQLAVQNAIDNHPKIKEAEHYTRQHKQQATLAQLQQNHPDMQEVLQDPKFADWVKGSKIRTQLFVQADQQYDYDAAKELFDNWKERTNIVQQTAKVEQQARKQSVKAASTGNTQASANTSRKKVYRRADIIKLMQTDPERYASLSDEIFQAYQEGRVK
tara:strand:- start:415 stop:1203 length:789 start_codon:yes stop_codon:yes gene_type:complete